MKIFCPLVSTLDEEANLSEFPSLEKSFPFFFHTNCVPTTSTHPSSFFVVVYNEILAAAGILGKSSARRGHNQSVISLAYGQMRRLGDLRSHLGMVDLQIE